MEALWVYSWLVWIPAYGKWPFNGVQRLPLSLVSLVFLHGASFFATSFFLKQKWPLLLVRLSIVSCGLVAIFLVVRIEYNAGYGLFDGQWFVYIGEKILDGFSDLQPMIIALIVGVGLCWRGIRWGSAYLDFEDIYRSFLIGLWAQVLLVIVWVVSLGTDSLSSLASSMGIYVAGYFFFGLSALAMCNLRAIQRKLTAREGAGTVLNRRWLSIMLGVIGVMTAVGIVLATIFSADVLALLGRALNTIADWLLQGLEYILLPFGYLVAGIFYVVRFIIQLIPKGEQYEPGELEEFGPSRFELEQAIPSGLPPAAVLAIKWAFIVIIIGLLVFLLTKAVRRVMSYRDTKHIEQIDESVWSWETFKADLRLFFSLLLKRSKRPKIMPVTSRQYTEETKGNLNIREIYQRLLQETSHLRIARRHSETPYEYSVRFSHAVPEGSEYLGELTDIYVNVRYGELDAEEKQIDFANGIWRALKSLLTIKYSGNE